MCRDARQVRSLVIFEGQMKWILERATAEEKLAAFETLAAIAFPTDEENPYSPPELPTDGVSLTPEDRTRRDVYNLFKDIIISRAIKGNGKVKDQKKVEAGRIGAARRYGKMCSDSTSSFDDAGDNDKSSIDSSSTPIVGANLSPRNPTAEEVGFNGWGYGKRKPTSEEADKKKIAEWEKKIPDASALKKWLEDNYMYHNKQLVCSEDFCEYAFFNLTQINRWRSTRDGRPLKDIRNAIHYMAIDYMKKSGDIRRAETEEHKKDIEVESGYKMAQASQQTSAELAALERKRRRKAEKSAMEKILKGAL